MTYLSVPVNDLALALAVLEAVATSNDVPREIATRAVHAANRLRRATEGRDNSKCAPDDILSGDSSGTSW